MRSLLVLSAVLLVGCRGAEREGEQAEKAGPAAVVSLTPRALALTQVETESAAVTEVPETFATTGQIEFDPSRIILVNAPVAGRVERVTHNVGDRVNSGDTLVTLASPEFLSGRFALTAPRAGVVTALAVAPQQVVTAGAEVIRVGAVDRVWLRADFYGDNVRFARPGARVTARVAYLPERAFTGRIASVSPAAESLTQSAVGRIPLDNPAGRLLPGIFADVQVETGRTIRGVLVPRGTVIYDGSRRLVMIQQDSMFFPAVIETGPVVGDRVVVLHGIRPGERVVTRGGYELYSAGYAFVRSEEGEAR